GRWGVWLWRGGGRGGRPPLLISAIAFGVAIAGMHYTAMAGLTVYPHTSPHSGAPALSPDLLAMVVAIVAFLMSGVFLLLFVPDRSLPQAELAADSAAPSRLGMTVPPAVLPLAPAGLNGGPAAPRDRGRRAAT